MPARYSRQIAQNLYIQSGNWPGVFRVRELPSFCMPSLDKPSSIVDQESKSEDRWFSFAFAIKWPDWLWVLTLKSVTRKDSYLAIIIFNFTYGNHRYNPVNERSQRRYTC